MLRVGLTGGLATGKSFVGRTFEELGCLWIQADKLGHQVLQPDGAAYEGVVEAFGSGILNEDGSIDRARLASEVFDQPERLEQLNRLVHPPVYALEEKLMAAYARRAPDGIAVVEAAILIETGSYKRFDRLIVTHCSEKLQVERALKREGASLEQVRARIKRQLPLAEKLKLADYAIDTSGSKEATAEKVRSVYESLRSIAS